jgi:hypothetical protein
MTEAFDLIEFQAEVRRVYGPRRLFHLWEEVCRCYDRGFIGQYELDEMKSVIYPKLHVLSGLKTTINSPSN